MLHLARSTVGDAAQPQVGEASVAVKYIYIYIESELLWSSRAPPSHCAPPQERGRKGKERKGEGETHIFEYVTEDVIGVWSQPRFLGRSPRRLTIGSAAAAEHRGKGTEKVSRRIWVAGPFMGRSARRQPVVLASPLWIREDIICVCDSLDRSHHITYGTE